MRHLQRVTMQFIERSWLTLQTVSHYEVRAKLCWYERWLVGFLTRLGALTPVYDRSVQVTGICFQPDDLVSKIVVIAADQLECLGRKPERVLLGSKQFDAMVRQETVKTLSRDFTFVPETRFGTLLYDVPVQVIPWMDGVLVI